MPRPRKSIIIQVINVPSYLLPHPQSCQSPPHAAAAYNHSKTPLSIRVRPQRMHASDAARSLDRKQKPNGRQDRGRHATTAAIEWQFTCKAHVKSGKNKRSAWARRCRPKRCLSVAYTPHPPRSSVSAQTALLCWELGSNQLLPNKTLARSRR